MAEDASGLPWEVIGEIGEITDGMGDARIARGPGGLILLGVPDSTHYGRRRWRTLSDASDMFKGHLKEWGDEIAAHLAAQAEFELKDQPFVPVAAGSAVNNRGWRLQAPGQPEKFLGYFGDAVQIDLGKVNGYAKLSANPAGHMRRKLLGVVGNAEYAYPVADDSTNLKLLVLCPRGVIRHVAVVVETEPVRNQRAYLVMGFGVDRDAPRRVTTYAGPLKDRLFVARDRRGDLHVVQLP